MGSTTGWAGLVVSCSSCPSSGSLPLSHFWDGSIHLFCNTAYTLWGSHEPPCQPGQPQEPCCQAEGLGRLSAGCS